MPERGNLATSAPPHKPLGADQQVLSVVEAGTRHNKYCLKIAVSLIVLNYSPKAIQARCDPRLELEVKVREDFTLTEKAFSWLKYKTLSKGTYAKQAPNHEK